MAGGVWGPFKELVRVVNAAILRKEPDAYYSLEAELKKHKPDFISLLKNPAKNPSHRDKIRKAKDGLDLPNLPHLNFLPQDFIDETMLLSDTLELNEISALELLLAGEQQLPHFPSYTRGLVAILLYHDGKRSIVSALRTLIQAREGMSWTLGLSSATVSLVTTFTNQLFEDGLVDKILSLLDSINVEAELKKLGEVRGIGSAQHRQDIIDFVTEQRTLLADCLLYWASQNPFPREQTIKILRYLQKVQVETPLSGGIVVSTLPNTQPNVYKCMDAVSLLLFHTLLACFNIGDNTTENVVDDSLIDEHYPLVADVTFLPALHVEILKDAVWMTPELLEAVRFAWGVLLRECASRAVFSDMAELEADGDLVEQAIEGEAIHFLRRSVVASPHFHQEELNVQRMHWLVTSFIVNMHLKIKSLRDLGEEVSRKGGGDMSLVPARKRGFEELMRLIGDLYSSDPNDLQLSKEFWPISDMSLHQSTLQSRVPHRQISLSKFLSTCSDFLPAPLFSPFMHMLTGLSSTPLTAHHCFNLLKANSPTLGGGGASAAISLEHFFDSLRKYYLGLRNGGGARAPPTGCVISPQEVQGLKDVLKIISTIAKLDENARIVMYENQSWLPVASLFGLIGCPIPRDLKAMVFHCLAAFALSPEIAGSMWHTLEAAQVLNTINVPGTGGLRGVIGGVGHQVTQEGSLMVELKEIESQAGEYPLTRSFLAFLFVLIDVPIPRTLGVGHRVPGFQPYLEFVRDTVFHEFYTREYRDRNEKWVVARLCLQIMHKLLSTHTISPEDFTQQSFTYLPEGTPQPVPKPPGHILLEHMLNNSELLEMVLSVLDEALLELSAHGPNPSEELAHAALLCLQLLGATLSKEEEFMDHVRRAREHEMSVHVHPFHNLLLGINRRSLKADHMLNVARYIGLTRCSPELALAAVEVLHGVSMTPKAGQDMTATIVGDKDACQAIIHGFVEHFEVEIDYDQDKDAPDSLNTVASVQRATQLQILKLLSSCIDMPAPNIAHLLLGFETGNGKHVSETILQDPGVSGSPRTCLHSILMLVDHGTGRVSDSGCHYSNPQLAELCYKVLYQLSSHKDLSVPTLRYLRNNHDFIYTQLTHLPLHSSDQFTKGDSDLVHLPLPSQLSLLHQQAWLLRTAAIELRMTLLNHQRSHMQRLLNLLLSEPNNGNGGGEHPVINRITATAPHDQVKSDFEFLQEGRRKILVLLDMVDFEDHVMPTLDMEYFDPAAVEDIMKQFETKNAVSGALYCDVKALHKLLMRELSSAQGSSLAGHQQSIVEEIHRVLEVVVQRNQMQATSHLAMELFESWRQLVEITLHAMLQDNVKRELKVAVLFELIQDLLIKIANRETSPLITFVHGLILILLSHLRQAVLSHPLPSEAEDSLLPSLYSGPLLAIMRGLMGNVLKAPAGMQQVRAYLYGSILYYLTMTHQEKESPFTNTKGQLHHRLWQPDSEQNTMATANLSTLSSYGEPFMDAVCKNACSGHDVARMLSLSVLDAVVGLDWHSVWLKFMSQHGYLQTLCASLQWEDESLKKMLHPVPEALRALYIYQSKMALLTRVANNPVGARELTSINALNYLSQCHFIDLRPSVHGDDYSSKHSHGFIPSVSERYRQLLFPLLKLLLALLTCPGSHHKELTSQVTSLIGTHSDIFAAILKEQHLVVTMETLQELAYVTAVIGHSGVGHDWSSELSSPFGSGLIRLQRLMLTLLPQFWSKQSWNRVVKEAVQSGEEEGDSFYSNQAFLLVQQISANIVSYCRVAMTMGGTEFSSPYCRIVLTPDLSEALPTPPSHQDPFSSISSGSSSSQPPSLGLLIQHLKECTEGFGSSFESYQYHSRKMETSGPLSSEDIRQLLPRSLMAEKVAVSQLQTLARKRLKTLVSNKEQEVRQYTYVVENLLYLLWRHLQFYLVHCKPVDPELSLGVSGIERPSMRRMQDYSSAVDSTAFDLSNLTEGVRAYDLEQLKLNSVKCLTDSLFKKLLDLEEAQLQAKSEMKAGFLQALVRRIKRLLKLKAAIRPL